MEITVTKLTGEALMRKACSFTINAESKMTLDKIYRAEHSPLRSQIFLVEMRGIPTFVSVHLTRHHVGIDHWVKSNRDDRGGSGKEDRWSPVGHLMQLNAQTLINLSRKRLCYKAHADTIRVMLAIREGVGKCDPDLARYMVPECVYRNGCHELQSCGYWGRRNADAA